MLKQARPNGECAKKTVMQRQLRDVAKGKEIMQDVSTLENPAILQQLKETLI